MKVKEESQKADLILNNQKKKKRSWHPVPSLHGKYMGKQWKKSIFLSSKITADSDCSLKIKRPTWKKSYDKPRQHIKKQKYCFADKGPHSQNYGVSSSPVRM